MWQQKLFEGLQALRQGKALAAFEDFSAARFYLMRNKEAYRVPLVVAFDTLLDIAWRGRQGKITAAQLKKAEQIVERIKGLVEKPRGEQATPPRRVKTVRDARLWDAAKYLVDEQYPHIPSDSDRYWQLVSRVFSRMKLRLGGMQRDHVEPIIRALQTKYGKLPPVPKGSKQHRIIRRMKELVIKELVGALLVMAKTVRDRWIVVR